MSNQRTEGTIRESVQPPAVIGPCSSALVLLGKPSAVFGGVALPLLRHEVLQLAASLQVLELLGQLQLLLVRCRVKRKRKRKRRGEGARRGERGEERKRQKRKGEERRL